MTDIPDDNKVGYIADEWDSAHALTDTKEYWIKGNAIIELMKQFIDHHPKERCEWFDITYISEFDITRLNIVLNTNKHKISISKLLEGYDYTLIDYDAIPDGDAINSDDLHILEQERGLL